MLYVNLQPEKVYKEWAIMLFSKTIIIELCLALICLPSLSNKIGGIGFLSTAESFTEGP